jgi:serine/threonine-protein kinase
MAPEQLEGREADARTDIFAFGALVCEMVTGRKAFDRSSRASLISAIMSSDPPPVTTSCPLAPPALDRVVPITFRRWGFLRSACSPRRPAGRSHT